MADFTISIDDEVLDALRSIADYKHISLDEYLKSLLLDDIELIRKRMNDPIIGSFESGERDISERVEDILYNEWEPD